MKESGRARIALVGGYGFDNWGDDLILRAALKVIRETVPDADIAVLSNNPFETGGRHRGEMVCYSPEALVRQILFRMISRVSGSYKNRLLAIPGGMFRQLWASISKASLVMSLGGGYINDNSRPPYPHLRLAELAFFGLCGKRLVMCAHELGPFHRTSSLVLARLAVKSLTYATVRDSRSEKFLLDLGFPRERVARTVDESWAYDPVTSLSLNVKRIKKKELTLAVNLMPLQIVKTVQRSDGQHEPNATTMNTRILTAVASCFQFPEFRKKQLHFLSMSSRDTTMGLRLRSILGGRSRVDIVDDLNSQYNALARSDILIGMRMHSVIMAAQVGVLPVAIAALPKVSETMSDLGLSDYTLGVGEFSAQKLERLLSRARQHSEEIRSNMNKRVQALRKMADMNIRPVQSSIHV